MTTEQEIRVSQSRILDNNAQIAKLKAIIHKCQYMGISKCDYCIDPKRKNCASKSNIKAQRKDNKYWRERLKVLKVPTQ